MFKVYMNVHLYVLCMNLANVNDLDVAMDMNGDHVASASSVFPPTSPLKSTQWVFYITSKIRYRCVDNTI